MAKRAKRRGRPPGSKSKVGAANGKPVAKMEVGQLRAYIGDLEALFTKKVQEQRASLESQLAALTGYVSSKAKAVRGAAMGSRKGRRAKAKPKYQSKQKPSLKWSGRGMTPTWMREEMKGTKLKKEDFAIK